MKSLIRIYSLLVLIIVGASDCLACPASTGYPDLNCDEKFTISFFGDSVTRGVGDPKINSITGGVPLRLKKHFQRNLPSESFKVINFGFSGIKCLDLKTKTRNLLNKNKNGAADSDVAIFACGLNDYFTHRDPTRSVAYLKAMRRLAKKHGIYANIALVTQTRRSWQQPWVESLNELLINVSDDIRYDLINPETMVSWDALHPNGAGYNFMFRKLMDFLDHQNLLSIAETQLGLTDNDSDGVYDSLEINKFGTNPNLADTDGDSINDGQEIFANRTDPLIAN